MTKRVVGLVVAVIGAVSVLDSGVADARPIAPPSGARVVTPGAVCAGSEAGDVGQSTARVGMLCVKAPGDSRLRWRQLDSLTHRLVASVDRLYSAYFLREADGDGFAYWIGLRVDGVPIGTISESFAQSGEFLDRYGRLDNGGFVGLVYRNLLRRAVDPTGLAYWRDLLDRQVITRGQMMAFLASGWLPNP